MNVTSSTVGEITVITASGSIDSKTASEFERTALAAIQGQSLVVMNLTDVEFLSSAGLRVLLMVYRQVKAKDGKVVLAGTSEEILDVMSDTGFLTYFLTTDTLEEGLNTLKTAR
ncbi:STAS domain-containing protein [Spirosoma agri]|uniref:Anti-sigma factor antagonist n=1 Tax=Spirosoma agri TaxID=1987381 RepID=A0A6M0IPX5_9BACT|nr:STAS domain-containing protein [Spirosoma agri]NEU70002.1 STAS domain-containing protein [Spirosoma agri]